MHNYKNLEAIHERNLERERQEDQAARAFIVSVTNTVLDKQVSDLLISAFEGGSNYWYVIEGYEGDTEGVEFPHGEIPLKEGGAILLSDTEGDDPDREIWRLDRKSIARGLLVMAEKYPRTMQSVLKETYDVADADVFLQCCLFGEVVFG